MDKEEYIFLNKKYENAVTAIKAHLFDVISNEEKKAMRIGLEMSREGISEEQYNKLQEIAMKQGEDLGRDGWFNQVDRNQLPRFTETFLQVLNTARTKRCRIFQELDKYQSRKRRRTYALCGREYRNFSYLPCGERHPDR